jgi:hypothetical protein
MGQTLPSLADPHDPEHRQASYEWITIPLTLREVDGSENKRRTGERRNCTVRSLADELPRLLDRFHVAHNKPLCGGRAAHLPAAAVRARTTATSTATPCRQNVQVMNANRRWLASRISNLAS